MHPFGLAIVAAVFVTGACSRAQSPANAGPTSPPGSGTAPVRVLMLTATAGYRHESITTARQVMTSLAGGAGFAVTATEDVSALTESNLAAFDVLFFALTSGELPLSEDQKSAMLKFVSGGGGFLGVHSAADTLYEWPAYGGMVGAYFKEHPWTQLGTVVVEQPSDPTTEGLGGRFSLVEEFYTFRDNPRPRVHVLLSLDAASVGSNGDFPLAWSQTYGAGRTYYNALGHFRETWQDRRFQQQITAAIQWASRNR